ncbi:MAG: tRNA (guanosine(37)-N1)-methyltransferase TrmD [Patescibacteria group bacterium]
MKKFDIISIFPESLESYFKASILKRAQDKKLIKISSYNLRDFTLDKHRKVDDKPYGGGAGMVMMAEPIIRALKKIKAFRSGKKTRIILLAANGKQFTQKDAKRLAGYDRLVFICGRYEGVDARVEKFINEKISIGPYVVTGGELPAAIIIDAVARMVPKVVGKEESVKNESFSNTSSESREASSEKYLEHPHYTRPDKLIIDKKVYSVPKVLLQGNHKLIDRWRSNKSAKIREK